MNKRNFLAGLLALPFTGMITSKAEAAEKPTETIRYKAKAGTKRIRVRAWRGPNKVIDIYINVEPGQTFLLESLSK